MCVNIMEDRQNDFKDAIVAVHQYKKGDKTISKQVREIINNGKYYQDS